MSSVDVLQGVIDTVKKETEIDVVNDKSRKREVTDARRVYGYLSKELTRKSLCSIGRKIGKDHATIKYYIETAEAFIESNSEFRELYENCLKNIKITPPKETLKKSFKHHVKEARKCYNRIQLLQ